MIIIRTIIDNGSSNSCNVIIVNHNTSNNEIRRASITIISDMISIVSIVSVTIISSISIIDIGAALRAQDPQPRAQQASDKVT